MKNYYRLEIKYYSMPVSDFHHQKMLYYHGFNPEFQVPTSERNANANLNPSLSRNVLFIGVLSSA